MHNRDVGRLVSIAVLIFSMFPPVLPTQTGDIIFTGAAGYYAGAKSPRGSHDNHVKKRRLHAQQDRVIIKRSSTGKKNRTAAPSAVKILKAPAGKRTTIHTVRAGDTLTNIARRNATTVEALISFNKLKNKNAIQTGMKIRIPPRNGAASVHSAKQKDNSPLFRWPVRQVISYHNDGRDGVKPIGIIITGKKGSPVFSSAPGTVKKIGAMRGFGKYVVISHKGRYSTVYANLDRIDVASGDRVGAGNAIGRINSLDQKLHFQIDLEGKPENPLKYLPENI